jgi:hypothetical protein
MGRPVKAPLLPAADEAGWYNPWSGQTKALPRLAHAGEGVGTPWGAPDPADQGSCASPLNRTDPRPGDPACPLSAPQGV